MIITPQTDGVFARYLRTEEQQPSIAMVYELQIDRGYVVSPGENPCAALRENDQALEKATNDVQIERTRVRTRAAGRLWRRVFAGALSQ